MPQTTQLDRIEQKVNQIEARLEGDGSDGHPGLIVRVDRMEQTHRMVKWLTGTAVAAAIASVGAAVKGWLHSGS